MDVRVIVACVALSVLGVSGAAAEERPLPFSSERRACDAIRIRWVTGGSLSAPGPAPVVVRNEGGTSGVRFYVDREHHRIVGMQTWRLLAGTYEGATLPGEGAIIEYVGCQATADTLGGILVEHWDAGQWGP